MQQLLGTLGVLVNERAGTPPFADESFCRKLCQEGCKFGMNVVIITPRSSEPDGNYQGYQFIKDRWVQGPIQVPDLIYDRCLTPVPGVFRRRLKQASKSASRKIKYLSRGLPGKWHIYNSLRLSSRLIDHLPETAIYSSKDQLKQWLIRYPQGVFLKPQAGTHGKSTVLVRSCAKDGKLLIQGRNRSNHMFNKRFANHELGLSQLHRILSTRTFIVQPYLPLMNHEEKPFDLRVLVQKNGHGQWSISGHAIREGEKGSLTSNLHGGGRAMNTSHFLETEYGKDMADLIIEKAAELSAIIPGVLEARYGRLSELGIDYGIDRNGRLWIIEINSKPGRASFLLAGDTESANLAYNRPLEYARYLLLRTQ
ncbi:YheC/YheD family protein [Neobacillus mesonae]|nr:YheC/YheD family protein [Neobacillus mesonae]